MSVSVIAERVIMCDLKGRLILGSLKILHQKEITKKFASNKQYITKWSDENV
jgi:hypothetical protein